MSTSYTPRWPWVLMGIALVSHIAAWLHLGPLTDEAYYWTWTQHLQLSYFDHPPMMAWLMWPFTTLLGNATWVIRLSTVLEWFALAWLIYRMAEVLFASQRTALIALLLWTSLPIIMGGFHIISPDTPLALFTGLTYYFFIQTQRHNTLGNWLLTGFAAGLALLSKYPAILIVGALFLALLFHPQGRKQLKSRGPWLAVLVMLLTFSPVIIWNAQHDWASFAFQFHHGVQAVNPNTGILLAGFIGGQMGVAMPWTLITMLVLAFKRKGEDNCDSLSWNSLRLGFLVPMLIFGLAGLTAESGPNWTLIAYIPGTLLMAPALSRWLAKGQWRAPLAIALYLLPLVVITMIRFPDWMVTAGIDPKLRTQMTHSYGWEQVATQLQQQLQQLGPRGKSCTVVAMNYQVASELALILNDVTRVSTAENSRFSQYNYWRDPQADLCLYVIRYDHLKQVKPQQVELANHGTWQRSDLLEIHNPDNTTRWFAFFIPQP